MGVNPLELLVGPVSSLLDKFIADKDERNRLAHEIATLAQRQAHANATAQIGVNAEQAKSGSLFVAGARPFIMWTCGVALANNFVILPYANMLLKVFDVQYTETVVRDGATVATQILAQVPTLDLSVMMPVLMGLLGLGGMRTYEKINGVARQKLG